MLGKGLESLIPQKDQSDPQADISGGPGTPGTNIRPPVQPDNPSPASMPIPASPALFGKPFVIDFKGLPESPLGEGHNRGMEISLEPEEREIIAKDEPKKSGAIFQIEVDKIIPNPHQPRRYFDEETLKELANSIREFGIIQPIVLSKIYRETDQGTEVYYQLIAGERRLLAAKMVGLRTVPAIIKILSNEREKLEIAIIENLQRADLNAIETARAYSRLQDEFGLTQREIASRIAKSRETVSNTLRLLNLPSEMQSALEERKINESQARLLLTIDDIAKQQELFQSLLKGGGTVRELRDKIKNQEKEEPKPINPEIHEMKNRLEEFLGTKVDIKSEGTKGKVLIDFYSMEELAGLVDKLEKGRID
jgi:ParB family chromosome partitioning protein